MAVPRPHSVETQFCPALQCDGTEHHPFGNQATASRATRPYGFASRLCNRFARSRMRGSNVRVVYHDGVTAI